MAGSYLEFAGMVYHFWNKTMTDSATGEVTDHYTVPHRTTNAATDGNSNADAQATQPCEKVSWSFTYNEGLMLGAATALGPYYLPSLHATRPLIPPAIVLTQGP